MINYDVSIIIVTRNRLNQLHNCIQTIIDNTDNVSYEIVVSDSSKSKNDRLQLLSNWSNMATIIFEKDNTPCAFSNNAAIRWSSGKYIYLLNDDCLVKPEWLSSALYDIKSSESIGAISSLIIKPNGKIEHGGSNLDNMANNILPKATTQVMNVAYNGFGLYKRSVLEMINFMPYYNVPIYFEDSGMGLEIWRAGYEIRYCPKSSIIHLFHNTERNNRNDYLVKGREEFMKVWGNFLKNNNGFQPDYPFTGIRPWKNGDIQCIIQ